MPEGTAIGRMYPSGGKNRGNNLHKIVSPEGGDVGNGMHKMQSGARANQGTAIGSHPGSVSAHEPRPRKRLRKQKPPTKALPQTPGVRKGGGALNQTTGKIV